MRATLLLAVEQTSAVFDGHGRAYVFGGMDLTNGENALVTTYDVARDSATPAAAPLLPPRRATAAFWDPRATPACAEGCAYVLGGIVTGEDVTNAILVHNPAAGLTFHAAARLPCRVYGATAVFDGTHAYLLGGALFGCPAHVVRYEPQDGDVTVMGARFPRVPAWSAAVWDARDRPEAGCPSGCAYLFGGNLHGREDTDAIHRYNPATDALVTLPTRLPAPVRMASAAFDGSHAYVIGGRWTDASGNQAESDRVVRYDPLTGSVETRPVRLPMPLEAGSVVWGGDGAYIFGGGSGPQRSAAILRYAP